MHHDIIHIKVSEMPFRITIKDLKIPTSPLPCFYDHISGVLLVVAAEIYLKKTLTTASNANSANSPLVPEPSQVR